MLKVGLLLWLVVGASVAFAETYDEARSHLGERVETRQDYVQGIEGRNAIMRNSVGVFAASQHQSVESGPHCPTHNDLNPPLSYWPGALAARSEEIDANTAYLHCDFTLSGGYICKSHLAARGGNIIGQVDCVVGQQSEVHYLVSSQGVQQFTPPKPTGWGWLGSPHPWRRGRRSATGSSNSSKSSN